MSCCAVFPIDSSETPVEADDLASNSGWPSFQQWASELPGEFPELGYLAEHGETYPHDAVAQLEADLKRALREKPGSPSADVLSVASRLLLILEQRPDDAQAILVTDGTEGDDEDDDEG